MFASNQQTAPFGGQSTGAFGGNNNLFGAPNNTPMLAKQPGGIFGNPPAAQQSFGNNGVAAQPLFGNNAATQPFGNNNQAQNFGGNSMNPQQPLFGSPQGFGNQQTTATGGALFGGNQPTGNTLFSGTPAVQNGVNGQTGGIFPSNNPLQNGVQPAQFGANTGNMFGTNNTFGNNPPANNLFGTNAGGNSFGQATNTGFPQQQNQTSPFGQQQTNSLPQQNTGFGNQTNTLFGGQPANNPLFGGNQNSAFKSPVSTNPFGQNTAFGQNLQQNINSSPSFGQNTASNNPFGGNQPNQGNNLFAGNPQANSMLGPQLPTMGGFNNITTNQPNSLQQPINPMASISLGGNTAATNNSFSFGANPTFGGSMANPSPFNANNTNLNTNIFNAGQAQANQNKQTASWMTPSNPSTFGSNSPLNTSFGTNSNGGFFGNTQNPQNTSFPMAANNTNDKFGGTSWGVPNLNNTNFQQPEQFKPVRTKNPKLDSKHLVKCISALDQFEGQCKEQIRLAFISSGGQQILQPQANTPVNNFSKSNNLTTYNSLGSSNGFNVPTQLPSFGVGLNTNNNFFGANVNAGQNPPSNPMFGQANGQNMSFGQISTANNALFEAKTNTGFGSSGTPNKAPLFGASPFNSQPNNTFNSPANSFGVNANTQKTTGLFGQNPGAALINQAATAASFFSNSNTNSQQGFLGQQNTAVGANNSLFGQPAQTNLFGATTPTGQTGLFGQLNSTTTNPSGLMGMNNGMNNGTVMNQLGNALTNMNSPNFNSMGGMYNPQNSFGNLYGNPSLSSEQILAKFNNNFGNTQSVFDVPALQVSPQGFLSSQPNMDILATLLSALTAQGFSVSQNLKAQTAPSTPFDELIASQPARPQFETRKNTDLAATTPAYKDARNYVIPTLDFDLADIGLNRSESSSRISKNEPEMKMKRVDSDDKLYPSYNARKERESSSISLSNIKYDHIPILCGFTISPNLETLKSMTVIQINSVKDVKISNAFGSIQFKQKINLHKKNLSHCIKIAQDCIQVMDPEWEIKKCEMTFKNFGSYLDKNEDDREKVIKKLNKWVAKMNMKIIKHDTRSGELIVSLD